MKTNLKRSQVYSENIIIINVLQKDEAETSETMSPFRHYYIDFNDNYNYKSIFFNRYSLSLKFDKIIITIIINNKSLADCLSIIKFNYRSLTDWQFKLSPSESELRILLKYPWLDVRCYQFQFQIFNWHFQSLEYKLSSHIKLYNHWHCSPPASPAHNEVGGQEPRQGRAHPAHPRAAPGGGPADHQRDGERHHGLQVLRDGTEGGNNITKGTEMAGTLIRLIKVVNARIISPGFKCVSMRFVG